LYCIDPNESMKKAYKILDELASLSLAYQKTNPAVSSVSVGWHIEHSCLVISKVTETVIQSNPAEYTKAFSFKKLLVLTLNKFPRGKAKAPAVVLPKEQTHLDTIQQHIQAARHSLELLATANSNQYFTHPIFGKLNKKEAFRFFYVHTSHHLKIIKDILANS